MPAGLRNRLGLPSVPTKEENDRFAVPFASSPFVSLKVLAGVRCLLALWTTCVLVVALVIQGVRYGTAGRTFSYYTFITYWSLWGYFAASAFHTVIHARTDEVPLASWPVALKLAHTVLYTSVATFPILVTIVYWYLLSGSSTFENAFWSWENISVHALNTVLSLIDVWFLSGAKPPPFLHLFFLIIFLLLYLALAYLTHATEGFYVYSFLSPQPKPDGVGSVGMVVAYCVGVGVGIVVVFLVAKGVLTLKMRYVRKWRNKEVRRVEMEETATPTLGSKVSNWEKGAE